jgi:hypothetical protein
VIVSCLIKDKYRKKAKFAHSANYHGPVSADGDVYKHIIRLAVAFTAQVSREVGDGVKLPNSLAMAHFLHVAGCFYPPIP